MSAKKDKVDRKLQKKHTEALLGDKLTEDVHNFRVNRSDFIIYVGGDPGHLESHSDLELGEPGVEYMMANRFEANLHLLSSIDPKRPLVVVMSSCGGDMEAGLQMFGALLTCPNPTTVIATKWARSMTSIIPLAADRFYIRPPAQYMYHHGQYATYGLDQEAQTNDIERRKSRELMFRIYVARLKEQGKYRSKPPKWIRKKLDSLIRKHIDVWFSADEAVEWGFADAIWDGSSKNKRAQKVNHARRKLMMEVLRRPINVEVKIS
ncbi:MAG: ATP-dependent Clp protease proteolytic subunit [Candidatus Pacebacteria bacterium]|jgi:ATP-dependent protease ClpP protease subunit|nr:ATP-dependent Clp protease proteolytic subunit [Candidatus Paceibacterota bacterium]